MYNFISTDLGNYNQMIINEILGFFISKLNRATWVVGTMFKCIIMNVCEPMIFFGGGRKFFSLKVFRVFVSRIFRVYTHGLGYFCLLIVLWCYKSLGISYAHVTNVSIFSLTKNEFPKYEFQ